VDGGADALRSDKISQLLADFFGVAVRLMVDERENAPDTRERMRSASRPADPGITFLGDRAGRSEAWFSSRMLRGDSFFALIRPAGRGLGWWSETPKPAQNYLGTMVDFS